MTGSILLQRRSKKKALEGGCWDLSCAEHVSAGESYLQAAVRGLREELGIHVTPDRLERIREAYRHDEIYSDKVPDHTAMCYMDCIHMMASLSARPSVGFEDHANMTVM